MNRRGFVKTTLQFGAGISFLGSNFLLDPVTERFDSKPFFILSLAQWSLHKAISETKTLSNLDFAKKARELGFDGIEYVSQLYNLEAGNETASLTRLTADLLRRSADNGIENVLIMIDNEGELAAASKAERTLAIEKHQKWVDAASALGCLQFVSICSVPMRKTILKSGKIQLLMG
ncbi:MAG TPA: hypothetical protein VF581_05655 [Flavobacterium sp.]|jgi:sugar phosphate isomerase/epimerase